MSLVIVLLATRIARAQTTMAVPKAPILEEQAALKGKLDMSAMNIEYQLRLMYSNRVTI